MKLQEGIDSGQKGLMRGLLAVSFVAGLLAFGDIDSWWNIPEGLFLLSCFLGFPFLAVGVIIAGALGLIGAFIGAIL